jgi:hypothetical protein
VFEDWKRIINRYIQKHIDRKPFQAILGELDGDIALLSDYYTAVLLENGVIDSEGNATDRDFDEDDLLDAMLERFLASHPGTDEQAVQYAALIDAYLALVEEASEDL